MIYIFLIILIVCTLLTYYVLRNELKFEKKNIFNFIIYFSFFFIPSTLIYLFISNYWIGSNITQKITNNISISEVNKIKPDDLLIIIQALEKKLINNPKDIETIKKIAQAKYFSLDFEGALKAFEKGRAFDKYDFDLMLGEANTRLLLEKENVSKKTIKLFEEIIKVKSDDISALIVLANYYYSIDSYILSKNYYIKLLSLIDKNSLEYKEILKRLEKIERVE